MELWNWIDGKRASSLSGEWLDNFEPARGLAFQKIPSSSDLDVDAAIEAASRAYPNWSKTPEAERAKILRKLATLIEENLETLARAESRDSGKPLKVARTVDIPRAALNFSFFADAITQWHAESFTTADRTLQYTLRQPLGVVACISPWNLPLYLLTWKIAPALAAGNCVVAKPSEVTPWTASLMAELSEKAGLPPGVLNIVHGLGSRVGTRLVTHPKVKAVSFTGSTRTGAEIAKNTAPLFKKLSLEMGGKNAAIVFEDANLERVVPELVRSAFSNQGQICLCGSRILVHESIYERVREKLVAATRALKVGDPADPGIDQGAVVSRAHFEKIMGAIATAKTEGGKVLCGGEAIVLKTSNETSGPQGWFIAPTLIEGLNESCSTNQEEIFGPVATLMPFKDEAHAVRLANSTRYGLAFSVWTDELTRAHRVAAALESGIVWINTWMTRDLRTPFGGVKDSGIGREGGADALRFFTEPKNVCIALDNKT